MFFEYHDPHLKSTMKIKNGSLLTTGSCQRKKRFAIIRNYPTGRIVEVSGAGELPPACHPCYPGSPPIGSGSYRQDRCSGLPLSRRGSTTPSCVWRLHPGSLALRPAGLLESLTEPLSGNLMLQVTLNTSLKLHGRTTELP